MATLGIDFGTSNSAAGLMAGDRPFLIPMPDGATTLPTAVFLDPLRKVTLFGSVANRALVDGREGRYMRALKSVLGTPLMHERRLIAHERLTLIEVVARFLAMLRDRATEVTGLTFDSVVSGRPVRFHSIDDARDAQAEADLREAYLIAGFEKIGFLYEPEAAALTAGPLGKGSYGLIVDIGGGTSDFSVFTQDPALRIIASHGVRIGGTDFDRTLSLAHVMPLLGQGGLLRNELGKGTHTAPNALFNDLASWEKIAFLYTPETQRTVRLFARLAVQPDLFERLVGVIEQETGHDIAFAVEAGKIAANRSDAVIDLSVVARGLSTPLGRAALAEALSDHCARIRGAAEETIRLARIDTEMIGKVVFVGGSSLMQAVVDPLAALLPGAMRQQGAAFTAVADGLAMAASRA